jgi:hypothetical protein
LHRSMVFAFTIRVRVGVKIKVSWVRVRAILKGSSLKEKTGDKVYTVIEKLYS